MNGNKREKIELTIVAVAVIIGAGLSCYVAYVVACVAYVVACKALTWLMNHVYPMLFLGVCALLGWFCWGKEIYDDWKYKRAMEKLLEESLARAKKNAKDSLNLFCDEFLKSLIIIDTNIWMNESYDYFFELLEDACKKSGYVVKLSGVQFDEIANIKKKKSSKKYLTRIAQKRIEHLQSLGILTITDMTVDARKYAYADPLIIKQVKTETSKGENVTVFTDDRELRIRTQQIACDEGFDSKCVLVNLRDHEEWESYSDHRETCQLS